MWEIYKSLTNIFFLTKPKAQVGDIPISNQHFFLIKPLAQVGDIQISNQHFFSY